MQMLISKAEIQKSVCKCASVINAKFAGKDVVVVGILKGAVYFYVDLTRKLTIPHSCYFIEATSYHDSQSQSGLSIFSSIASGKFTNKHVILVDELYDGGKTMDAIKRAIHEKANVPYDMIFTCALFKKNKKTEYPALDLYGISLPDVWVVGYGLDDKQQNRHFESLYAVPKIEGIEKTDDDKMFDDPTLWNKIVNDIIVQCNP
jgi:hypoxanthine phosphoribosyltransferase